ncbi:MAG: ElyC/SanA/YdcF family protein [Opitutaceae bacterium]|jgi:uncharacterized SAM-binding protein YcdF (DUF218 family)
MSVTLSLSYLLYIFKKIIGTCLMPLPMCLGLLALGLLLTRRGKQSRTGRWLIIASFAWLLLAGNMGFSRLLLHPLEYRYPAIPEIHSPADIPAELAGCTAVVVLGSGHTENPTFAASTMLCESALGRIVEGVRIARNLPQAILITSGSGDGKQESHGLVLSRSAQSMGMDVSRIRVINSAFDTQDEAKAVKQIVKRGKIALVTSAFHMPRALAMFRKQGLDAVPCPADFKGKPPPHTRLSNYVWDSESLFHTTLAVHEYIGYFWSMLRGQV